MIDCCKDYVYLNDVWNISTCDEPHEIDVTTLENDYISYVPAKCSDICEISVDVPYTEKMIDVVWPVLSNRKKYRTRIEMLGVDTAFETTAYIEKKQPEISATGMLAMGLNFYLDDELKMFDTVVPEECTCPNCGAKIKSRYGCCDYCGGWVEWEF